MSSSKVIGAVFSDLVSKNGPATEINSHLIDLLVSESKSERTQYQAVSQINGLLSNYNTRGKALQILVKLLPALQDVVIADNALTWTSYIVGKQRDKFDALYLRVLSSVIIASHKQNEFNKKFIADYLTKVVDLCLQPHPNLHESIIALNCLNICLQYYSTSLNSQRGKIEAFLIKCLDTTHFTLAERAAVGYLHLQVVGNGGDDGINHIRNFSISQRKLCATVHFLLDAFLENQLSLSMHKNIEIEPYKFPEMPISYDEKQRIEVIATRLKNCLCFLETMYRQKFSVVKQTYPNEVLELVQRGLSLHICSSNQLSINERHFAILLNKLQVDLLRFLQIYLLSLQREVLPYCNFITETVANALIRVQKCDCFKLSGIYQASVYSLIQVWIKIAQAGINSVFQEKIITCILHDITPNKETVILTINSTHKKSNKRKAIEDKIIASGNASINQSANSALEVKVKQSNCIQALITLQCFLENTFLDIKEELIKKLNSVTISVLLDLLDDKVVEPYTHDRCKLHLHKVLYKMMEQYHLKTLPPLEVVHKIFINGQRVYLANLSFVCAKGLSLLEKITQATCPTMYIARDICNETENANIQNMNIVSKSSWLSCEDIFGGNEDLISSFKSIETSPDTTQEIVSEKVTVIQDVVLKSPAEKDKHITDEEQISNTEDRDSSKTIIRATSNDFNLSAETALAEENKILEKPKEHKQISALKENLVNIVKQNFTNNVSDLVDNKLQDSTGVKNLTKNDKIDEGVPNKKLKLDETEDMLSSFVDQIND